MRKLLFTVTLVAGLTFAAVAWSEAVDCSGGGVVCTGTSESDTITGTPNEDEIVAKAGDDLASGRGGSDDIAGGRGVDILRGGAGGDFVTGGPGADDPDTTDACCQTLGLFGGRGQDVVVGGGGADGIAGGPGADLLRGGRQDDDFNAFDGRVDVVRCGPGFDEVNADGDDVLFGCEAAG